MRVRLVVTEPSRDGAQCPALTEDRQCSTQGCEEPHACQVSDWAAFGQCSKPCGSGKQARVRQVVSGSRNGGMGCPELQEQRDCNTHGCDQPAPEPAANGGSDDEQDVDADETDSDQVSQKKEENTAAVNAAIAEQKKVEDAAKVRTAA